jgi:hypothetical protein
MPTFVNACRTALTFALASACAALLTDVSLAQSNQSRDALRKYCDDARGNFVDDLGSPTYGCMEFGKDRYTSCSPAGCKVSPLHATAAPKATTAAPKADENGRSTKTPADNPARISKSNDAKSEADCNKSGGEISKDASGTSKCVPKKK